jgi:hypothetical protein
MNPSKSTQANAPLNYQTAFSKGRKLLELMRANSSPTASTGEAAKYTQTDLSKWGWSSSRYGADKITEEHVDFLASIGTDACFRGKLHDGTGGDNIDLTSFHKFSVTVDSTLYPATDGLFSSVMNGKAGLFIAVNNTSPATKAKRKEESSTANPTSVPLPPLRHWSDIAYLQWCQLPSMGVSPSPLRYILRAGVQNQDSIAIMSRVLGFTAAPLAYDARNPKRPRWPGKSYKTSTWDAQALLGTPNGAGVGYLVAQHKDELKIGSVEKVTIYFTNNDDWERVNMLFWLGDGGVDTEEDGVKKIVPVV